jgi:hypothetical protein
MSIERKGIRLRETGYIIWLGLFGILGVAIPQLSLLFWGLGSFALIGLIKR